MKTLWKKEKLLGTSNFSFSYSAFKRLKVQTRKKKGLFGKGLTHYHTMPHFDALKIYIAVEIIVGKGGIALKCRLQFVSIWTSLKLCRFVMG